jgi:hypothetical protein
MKKPWVACALVLQEDSSLHEEARRKHAEEKQGRLDEGYVVFDEYWLATWIKVVLMVQPCELVKLVKRYIARDREREAKNK